MICTFEILSHAEIYNFSYRSYKEMGFFTKSYLESKVVPVEKSIKGYSYVSEAVLNAKPIDYFDIFLSHSYKDSVQIENLKLSLEEDFDYTVYVDWLEDSQLDRSKVDDKTASLLRKRMTQCKCLLFATSRNSSDSKWMPWELGYFDGIKHDKVAILPIIEDKDENKDFNGQEYLGLYPTVRKNPKKSETDKGIYLWVKHKNQTQSIIFKDWLTRK